ncbi:MAG: sigma factor-like helix-turn-helix DNA-binding protein [Potamolinea sp.]
MNEIDQLLKHLAVEAQQHPSGTLKRQIALGKLLNEIQKSGRLTRPTLASQFRGSYEEIYAVAKQRLFQYICEKIDNYDQNREVLQWANFILETRFPDAIREVTQICKNLDLTKVERLTLDDLEKEGMSEATTASDSDEQDIKKYLKEDLEGIFREAHIRDNPQANFQFISLQIAEGYSYKEIAEKIGIPYQTLNSFYKRTLAKFKPKIEEYLSE